MGTFFTTMLCLKEQDICVDAVPYCSLFPSCFLIFFHPLNFLRLQEILQVAEDMAIDIPHIWLYLAEQITPMLHEGGIPMGELFRSVPGPAAGGRGGQRVEITFWLLSDLMWSAFSFSPAGRFQSL